MNRNNYGKIVLYEAPVKIKERYWFPYLNTVYSLGITDKKIKKEFNLPTMEVYGFHSLTAFGNKVILSPSHAQHIAVYDMERDYVELVDFGCKNQYAYYHMIFSFEEKIFILPSLVESGILVLDKEKRVHKINVDWYGGKAGERIRILKCAAQDKYLWITTCDSNQLIKLNMINEQYELVEIETHVQGYTGIAIDNENIWLAEASMGDLIQYNSMNGKLKRFKAPNELDYNLFETCSVHSQLHIFDKCIISTPALAGQMTIFDKKTEQYRIIKNSFLDPVLDWKNNYRSGMYSTSSFSKKIDENTLWIQRNADGEIASINVEELTYATFSVAFEEKEIEDMLERLYRCGKTEFKEQNIISVKALINYVKTTDNDLRKQEYMNYGVKILTGINFQ